MSVWAIRVLGFVALIIALGVARDESEKLKARNEGALPFFWGYFFSVLTIFNGVIIIIVAISSFSQRQDDHVIASFLVGLGLIESVAGFGSARRIRTALIVSTIFSLNPIIWIVNSVYLRNRWAEFGDAKGGPSFDGGLAYLNRKGVRVGVALVLSWVLSVSAYAILGDAFKHRYGYQFDWSEFFVWIFVPPLLGGALYVLYRWATNVDRE